LAEDEAQLLRWAQLRLVGAVRGAWLGQIERTEKIATEVTFVTADLGRGSFALRSRRCHAAASSHLSNERTAGIKAPRAQEGVQALRKTQTKEIAIRKEPKRVTWM
jgi:hypothetical protein